MQCSCAHLNLAFTLQMHADVNNQHDTDCAINRRCQGHAKPGEVRWHDIKAFGVRQHLCGLCHPPLGVSSSGTSLRHAVTLTILCCSTRLRHPPQPCSAGWRMFLQPRVRSCANVHQQRAHDDVCARTALSWRTPHTRGLGLTPLELAAIELGSADVMTLMFSCAAGEQHFELQATFRIESISQTIIVQGCTSTPHTHGGISHSLIALLLITTWKRCGRDRYRSSFRSFSENSKTA